MFATVNSVLSETMFTRRLLLKSGTTLQPKLSRLHWWMGVVGGCPEGGVDYLLSLVGR
jgi:hypothetical protein